MGDRIRLGRKSEKWKEKSKGFLKCWYSSSQRTRSHLVHDNWCMLDGKAALLGRLDGAPGPGEMRGYLSSWKMDLICMLFQQQLAGRVNQCSKIYSSIVIRSSAISAHAPVYSCAACITPAGTAVSCRKLNTHVSCSVRELSPHERPDGKSHLSPAKRPW